MNYLWKITEFVSGKMKVVGAACLFGMVLLTCADVIGRFFKHPVFGSVELVVFMGVLAVAMSLPFTHQNDGHIGVELFVRNLPKKTQSFISLVTSILSLGLFVLVTWRMFRYAVQMHESGEVSMNLELPEYLIIFALSFGFVVFTLTIIRSIVNHFTELVGK